MTLLRRRVRDAARRPFVAAGTLLLVAGVVAFGASLALPARAAAEDETAEIASLRSALERAFVAAERDHAVVRADGFPASLGGFPGRLAPVLAEARKSVGADDEGRPARLRAAVDGAVAQLREGGRLPLSDTTLRVVLLRLLPRDARTDEALTAERVRDELVAEARDVFAAERFEDCWDQSFQDLPEVVAWRAAHAPRTETPPGPGAGGPKGAEGESQGPPPPPAEAGGGATQPPGSDAQVDPTARDLPSPFAPDPTLNLVFVDTSRRYVGPWTGWIQEIPERDNRRQTRPAKPVWIDRYEVTCQEYLHFLRLAAPDERRGLLPVGWSLGENLEPACPAGRERTAVTNVTFAQAQAYAASVGKRLPTEDEWERAAAGGDKEPRAFPWGEEPAKDRCAFGGSGSTAPEAVDGHARDRTPDGVVGLAGNVAEMVATQPDRRDLPSKLAPTDPVVVRGGSWRTAREAECGTSFRWILESGQGSPWVGFRCVMDDREYRRRFR